MSIHNHHYRDPDFSTAQTADYILLVQVGIDSFSYAVAGRNRLFLLEENISLNELNEPDKDHSLLFDNYKKRVIGLPQNGFTFMPVSLFRPDQVTSYARFLDVKVNEKVFSQPLDSENQVIYKVDEQTARIADRFDVKNTVFGAKGWIDLIGSNNPSNHNLYLNIDSDKVEFLNYNDGKLRFYNSFEFKTPDELVYFTMVVAGELKVQPQNTSLILSGDISTDDENFGRLSQFFHSAELNTLKTIDLPWNIAAQNILTLTALSLCGSSEAL
ncbi:DUF3822 family protein [Mucilaginibacter sp. McL0603]|uniref:DUF3822 family protein n=1 Tax=Mucilaginibacter sp. McL0603 TaxID=3415670 RepID=UPI003CF7AFEB